MKKYGKIRAIVIQSGSKDKRAMIYTNDIERKAEEIIGLMCWRWGEENLIKSLKLEHYLDYYPGKGLAEENDKFPFKILHRPKRYTFSFGDDSSAGGICAVNEWDFGCQVKKIYE